MCAVSLRLKTWRCICEGSAIGKMDQAITEGSIDLIEKMNKEVYCKMANGVGLLSDGTDTKS